MALESIAANARAQLLTYAIVQGFDAYVKVAEKLAHSDVEALNVVAKDLQGGIAVWSSSKLKRGGQCNADAFDVRDPRPT